MLMCKQARDAAGNNRTDAADRWSVRYSVVGTSTAEEIDLPSLGGGVYSAPLNLLSIGSGSAQVDILLTDTMVEIHLY